MTGFARLFCWVLLAAFLAEPGARAAQPPPAIPDVEVLDQDGRRLHFYTDLIRGKAVVINFVYTSCTALCPMLGSHFAKLQAALKGRDVFLISVSTDPETDTPERLKAWGERFGAQPGWTLVTGEKEPMDELLRGLTGGPPRQGDHAPAVWIGNDETGAWIREFGLADPGRYIEILEGMAAKPVPAPSDQSLSDAADSPPAP